MNPDESLKNKYIISFDTKDDTKQTVDLKQTANNLLFEKVKFFYNKLKENCISDSKNTDNKVQMCLF